jgi:signal transduction histidine kinase
MLLSFYGFIKNICICSHIVQYVVEANEQLKVHDKMQKEFVNIAAHELRTPVQPILGLSDVLLSKKGNIKKCA